MQDAALSDLDHDARLALAQALDEAYMPRFAGDGIAPSRLGQVLAIAERLDTLAGGFAAGLKPTGNKDPFALRRNALGLARTLIEGGMHIDFHYLLQAAVELQPVRVEEDESIIRPLEEFVYERLRHYYEEQGVPMPHFESAKSADPASLLDFDRRLAAIAEFVKLPEAEALAAANKRIRNILKKSDAAVPGAVDPALLAEPAERDLHAAVEQAVADSDDALARRDYVAVLARLARLRPQVDAFFDGVMVNVEDPALRGNRLALLRRLSERLGSVAAIEHLST